MNTLRIFFAAGLVLLVLAACGGPGPQSLSISMREFSFTPDALTVPAGATVNLTLRNLGALEHDFHLMDLGYVVEGTWSEADEAGAFFSPDALPGGEDSTVTFTAPNEPGEYQILCSVPSHLELGMVATLTVTP